MTDPEQPAPTSPHVEPLGQGPEHATPAPAARRGRRAGRRRRSAAERTPEVRTPQRTPQPGGRRERRLRNIADHHGYTPDPVALAQAREMDELTGSRPHPAPLTPEDRERLDAEIAEKLAHLREEMQRRTGR